ncbi:MAG: choline monooxygenase [Flavobacteriales bacterium]|nr:choline monooxygenase [Flavobacteriales bacterium]|tara:strand:- start:6596 stop:7681 length:1086 start_codon:yes stop_codon:yes gene_type:complete
MENIKENIEESCTLPSSFYSSQSIFYKTIDKIFVKSWQFIIEDVTLSSINSAYPFTLIDAVLPEPLFLVRNDKGIECYSNVCTHRGNLLIDKPCLLKQSIVCGYHGRSFDFSGKFLSMPETKGMKNFPCKRDDLPKVNCSQWNQFVFTSLDPLFSLDALFYDIEQRVGWMPVKDFVYRKELSKEYTIDANWALYCDNYLEGFHIPFIHKELNSVLNYKDYEVEVFPYSSLQIGYGKNEDDCFDLPESSADFGKNIAAYYFWLFPNIMMNFYPWGLSMNIITPLSFNKTKIEFRCYVWNEELLNVGAGADVNKVELEDQEIIRKVQSGINSRLYKHGRFSPNMEKGVHHFHRLIQKFMSSSE